MMLRQDSPTTIVAETIDYLIACWEGLQHTAMNYVLALDGSLDDERLRRAIRLTLDAEPILGCRFVERWYRPVWRRREDLDELELCRVRHTENEQADIQRFLTEPLDQERCGQVTTVLMRGATDTLCIKLNHQVGDGQALQQYVALLSDTYNRLQSDPAYRPAQNPNRNRSLAQLDLQVSPRRRREIRREIRRRASELPRLGHWPAPQTDGSPRKPRAHVRHVDARRYAPLFEYACRHRATVHHVLLGALFVAAYEQIQHTAGSVLPLRSIVDLRRYLTDHDRGALCNLFGIVDIWIEAGKETTLDRAIEQARDQMLAIRKIHLGLSSQLSNLESAPIARRVLKCVPYRWLKALLARQLDGWDRSMVILTDVGPLSVDRLGFGGRRVIEAYVTTGMIHDPKVLIVCVSSFRNSLTLSSNASHSLPVDEVLDRMLDILPD